ncbi:hypothetical protein H4582DRAFT_2066856, partial [Lactarius indigo]
MAYCDRCERCDIDFASEESLIQHYGNSPKHHYCKECDQDFDSANSKMQHMEAKHWYCETHDRVTLSRPRALVLQSEYSLESHYRQSDDHIYCVECENFDDNDDEWWAISRKSITHAPRAASANEQLEQHDLDVHRMKP